MTKTQRLATDFLALPAEALPSAQWAAISDEDAGDTAWEAVRQVARGAVDGNLDGETVRLHADRDEWRDGVVLTIE